MEGIYGQHWGRSFGQTPDATGMWALALKGLTQAQLWDGIEKCIKSGSEWPPAAPQFRAMCLPGNNGVMSLELAYAEAGRYLSSPHGRDPGKLSDVVYHTLYNNMDFYAFTQMSVKENASAFKMAYAATVEQLANGFEIKKPAPKEFQVEHKPEQKEPVDQKAVEAVFKRINAMFEDDDQ